MISLNLSCAYFVVFLVITSLSETTAVKVELTRHKTLHHLLEKADNEILLKLDTWYNATKGSQGSISLLKYLDSEFYGTIQVGSPYQSFKVVFDTAWEHSWIPSSLCPVFNWPCELHTKYDGSRSNTRVPVGTEVNISTPDSTLAGFVTKDLFHIAQINITDQAFVEATYVPYVFLFLKADGVLGMPKANLDNATTPFFFNMINQGKMTNPIFSIYINRNPGTKDGGTLLLGDTDAKHYRGDINYVNVVPDGTSWNIKIDSITVTNGTGKISLCAAGCMGYLDTSSTHITGPPAEIDQILREVKATYFLFGYYLVNCDKVQILPAIIFNIGGKPYKITSAFYVQQATYQGFKICLAGLAHGSSSWQIGTAFMSKYYTVFDHGKNRVGLAPANP